MVARFLRKKKKIFVKIHKVKAKEFRYNIKKIKRIYLYSLIYYIKHNKDLYKLFFKKNDYLDLTIMNLVYDFFLEYFLYKFYKVKYFLCDIGKKQKKPISFMKYKDIQSLKKVKERNKKQHLKKKKNPRLKKKNQFRKLKKYKKFKRLRKFRKFLKKKYTALKEGDFLETRVYRYFKTKIDSRIPITRNILRFNNLIVQNLMKFDAFFKKPETNRKKVQITKTQKMFISFITQVCHKFFSNTIKFLYKKTYLSNYIIKNSRFLNRIFIFCYNKDHLIKTNKSYLINNIDTEFRQKAKKRDFLEELDSIQFCSGLMVKFILKRRNCFFHIWDENTGFTLARISGGVFGSFYKKIYRKYKQFVEFIKFFKQYFNSILMQYRQKIFLRFKYLRKNIVKNLNNKLKKNYLNSDKKVSKKNLKYNGISFIFFYRSKLNITYIIQMRKSFFQAKSLFNLNWSKLTQTFRLLFDSLKISTNRKSRLFRRIFTGYRIKNILKKLLILKKHEILILYKHNKKKKKIIKNFRNDILALFVKFFRKISIKFNQYKIYILRKIKKIKKNIKKPLFKKIYLKKNLRLFKLIFKIINKKQKQINIKNNLKFKNKKKKYMSIVKYIRKIKKKKNKSYSLSKKIIKWEH